ncbi:Predicted ATPase [Mesorhizobium albiziae]|uniref:Predicted ATPase n=1 Tax=Neomesorhizobium albiziae TaxID=335020 RepID=A0A1I3VBB2_9HYPH|nr:AAA family ATPase [Mesorhizobium albiziae]GLS28789.1 ATPase [Mesorhizobium albiziae]SFJ92492.1 Predicted ATPase [Mesorhizobium albiziae]
MSVDSERFFVLTGGPGAGKTSLISALVEAGFSTTPEAGRAIIRQQQAVGGSALPWLDPPAFAELMIGFDMNSHRLAADSNGPVFFDRGVPDTVGYLRLSGLPVPAHMFAAADELRYNRRVLVLPPWSEIFGQDAERKQNFAEAVRTFEAVTSVYRDLGYELVEVPRAPVEVRMRFVLAIAGDVPLPAR